MNNKLIVVLLVLMLGVTGCNYVTTGSSKCEPPAVAMSDINGNTVCVITPESGVAVEESPMAPTTGEIPAEVQPVEPVEPVEPEESIDEVVNEKTLLEVAAADPRFTTFVDAMQAADLTDLMLSDGPLTIFAPTDEAFKSLDSDTIVALLADIPTLKDVLLYHVVEGKVVATDLINMDRATTVQGNEVAIKIEDNSLMVNNATVIVTDIEAANGVIHVIDDVLLPPNFEVDIIEPEETTETVEPVTPVEPVTTPADVPVKEVTAGELVSFPNLKAIDAEGDPITFTFSSPLDENGEWMTTGDDVGEHSVVITASDGVNDVAQRVLIVVKAPNRAPTIGAVRAINIEEGELVKISPTVSDPDGDQLSISYGEPLNVNGEWQTEIGDAGTYDVQISVTDGVLTSSTTARINVALANQPPIMQDLPDVEVDEGDIVSLVPTVTDADGDAIELVYSGWITDGTYTTTKDDAGVHLVTITATDGINSVVQQVTVTVRDVNRPPVFDPGSFV